MSIEYHEPPHELSASTRDRHRALSILCEELEAIDWYQHRLDTSEDETLRDLMRHNMIEEMEHAAMTLEWLRRALPELDEKLRKYVFSDGPIASNENTNEPPESETSALGLRIGSLRRGEVSS